VNPNPLASASIAQVHKGYLEEVGEVAVKIKRPEIQEKIIEDFEVLLFGISLLKKISSDHKIQEFEILFKEYFDILKYEIDFNTEIDNLTRFSEYTKGYQGVRVPYPVINLSNSDVIVMDYLPSIRVDNIKEMKANDIDTKLLAKRLAKLMLRSILEYGLVHIDPHPGNLGVSADDGSIVMYDFGMMLDLGKDIQEQLMKLFFAISDRNVKDIRTVAIEMGMVIVEPIDIPVFDTFLTSVISYLDTSDLDQFRQNYLDKQKDPSDVPFMLSSRFVLLMRGLSIMEGVCKKLDPDFNVQKTIEEHFRNRFSDVRYLEARALADIQSLWSTPLKVEETTSRLDALERTVIVQNTEYNNISNKLQTTWSVMATLAALWFAMH
jgi:predicted unusual protein kinase regulating ubiquinone biosynthesis (AarF/ABC1/UbiB family)